MGSMVRDSTDDGFSFKSVLKKIKDCSMDSSDFLRFDILDGFTDFEEDKPDTEEKVKNFLLYTHLMLEHLPDIEADDDKPLVVA
mmetsp:Transcript_28225/g.42717  ORF Transcript_28225/g.42717 Transcript_28225/m.42717 type:complete len:84 (-) Transcript_28225:30-281(-)